MKLDSPSENERPDAEHTATSNRIVTTVAAKTGVRTDELPLLYDSVDPDALDAVVGSGTDDLVVAFPFAGHEVFVRGDGTVRVEE